MKLDEIYLSDRLTEKLFEIIEATHSRDTAQELAEEILENGIQEVWERVAR